VCFMAHGIHDDGAVDDLDGIPGAKPALAARGHRRVAAGPSGGPAGWFGCRWAGGSRSPLLPDPCIPPHMTGKGRPVMPGKAEETGDDYMRRPLTGGSENCALMSGLSVIT